MFPLQASRREILIEQEMPGLPEHPGNTVCFI